MELTKAPPPIPAGTAPAAPAALPVVRRPPAAVSARRSFEVRHWGRLRLAYDLLVLHAAAAFSLVALTPDPGSRTLTLLALSFPWVAVVGSRRRELRDDQYKGSVFDNCTKALTGVLRASMLLIAIGSVVGVSHSVGLGLRLAALAGGLVAAERTALVFARRRARRNPSRATPTLIVGAGVVGQRIGQRLLTDRGFGLLPVGFLDADPLSAAGDGLPAPLLGSPVALADAVQRTGARHVILAFTSEPDSKMLERIALCESLGVAVSLVPRLYESINDRASLDLVAGIPMLSLRRVHPRSWQFAVKHAMDRVIAVTVLLLCAPLMAAITLLVWLDSPGPALFRQRRVGRDGTELEVLKFRTMRSPSSGQQAFTVAGGIAPGGVEGEDRRTRTGRWLRDSSLDELPQLFNVLRGEMSLIGPRPERPEFTAQFSQQISRYDDRHRVKSGMTGWAQVHGLRGQTSIADRVEWDNYYIQNWSLMLDVRILGLTIIEVLRPHADS